jgi:hypothetical protein
MAPRASSQRRALAKPLGIIEEQNQVVTLPWISTRKGGAPGITRTVNRKTSRAFGFTFAFRVTKSIAKATTGTLWMGLGS